MIERLIDEIEFRVIELQTDLEELAVLIKEIKNGIY